MANGEWDSLLYEHTCILNKNDWIEIGVKRYNVIFNHTFLKSNEISIEFIVFDFIVFKIYKN